MAQFDLAPLSLVLPKPDDPGRMRAAIISFYTFCKYNSEMRNADDKAALTSFHCVSEPPISLADYIDRLDRHTKCGEALLF